MIVTILGSGTCVPSLKRSSCSVLVEVSHHKLVIDCGAGTMRRLLRAGASILEVTHLLLSHFHPDHTGELVPFLFALKYPESMRRQTPLYLMAGKGLSKFYDALKTVYGDWIEVGPGIPDIIEFDTDGQDSRSFDDFTVETLPVNHREESLSYRIIDENGHTVVYSGDTDLCEGLVHIAKDADLFICESAMPDELKVDGHLTPSLAGDIAARANVKKLVLTHLYPECDTADIEKECRKTYQGPLELAEDLMRFDLGKP
jgi:ribonuclease BN (tRNA processing enzyme)